MSTCCIKRCKRDAVKAYDVRNPWPIGPEDLRHYEVCQKHADELWPDVPERDAPAIKGLYPGLVGRYLSRDEAERIRKRAVPS